MVRERSLFISKDYRAIGPFTRRNALKFQTSANSIALVRIYLAWSVYENRYSQALRGKHRHQIARSLER